MFNYNRHRPISKSYFDDLIVFQLDKPESTANNVKRSVSSFFDQVGSALSPPPDDGDEEAIVIQGNNPVFLNRLQVGIIQELKKYKPSVVGVC